jgi:manganese/zinc/iron transport system ATP- binding protein
VAGPDAEVQSLLPPRADPHSYEPTPQDAQQIAQADLIVVNGLRLEGWLHKLVESAQVDATIVTLTDGLRPFLRGTQPDPHAWLNPRLVADHYLPNALEALLKLLPHRADALRARAHAYGDTLRALDAWIASELAQIPPRHRLIATPHDSYQYYAQRYGLRVVSLLGLSTDADIRMGDMQALYDSLRTTDVRAIFAEASLNPKLLRQLASDLKIRVYGPLYADALGGADVPDYLALQRHNTQVIVAGLMAQDADLTLDQSHAHGSGPAFTAADPLAHEGWLLVVLVIGLTLGSLLWVLARVRRPSLPLPPGDRALVFAHLAAGYADQVVLRAVSLRLEPGNIYGVVGPNGAGKSTLLRTLLGLQPALGGQVRLAGLPLADLSAEVAYVPQRQEIDWQFPVSVLELALLGRLPRRGLLARLTQADLRAAYRALDAVRLRDLARRPIGLLSGGQQQRAFLAACLAQDAFLLVLDEPFAAVDQTTERELMALLRAEAARGKLILVVHHNLQQLEAYFDAIIRVEHGTAQLESARSTG